MSLPNAPIGGRYRLVEQVGSGGMGVVWRAWDERLQRPVAVKQLRLPAGATQADAELATSRAMREARITARLHHPHAVAVFDVVEHAGQPCLVMQFVPSIPLSAVLREGGPLELGEAARLGAEVASALAAAHALGIVHRDVKPGNILVAEDGSALLSDFGISRAFDDATLTTTGMVSGTPAYFSPEVARGADADAASDVYSFGATLYAALEGAPPSGTDPNPIALLHKVAANQFDPPQRSGPLAPLLVRMLATEPAARPPMAAVAAELTALRPGRPRDEQAEPTRPRPVAVTPPPAERTAVLPAAAPLQHPTVVQPTRPAAATGPPPAEPGPPAPAAAPAVHRRRPRAWLVVAALLALVALGVGLSRYLDSAGSVAAGPPSPSAGASSAAPRESASAEASEPASSAPPPSATPEREPSRSATPTPTPSPSRDRGPTAADLERAVTDYYALLPGGTDAAWERLTPRYRGVTGGRAGFDGFWAGFSSVKATRAEGTRPDRAEATITYVATDGSRSSERRSFTFVEDDDVLTIDGSQIISSTG